MKKKLLGLPYYLWCLIFILAPLCMVFYYGLTDKNGIFTFQNVSAISSPEHLKALLLALVLSLIATFICLLLSYPLSMILCGMKKGQNSLMVFIFILPMWMNFLLRTLAWQTLLEKTVPVKVFHLPVPAWRYLPGRGSAWWYIPSFPLPYPHP